MLIYKIFRAAEWSAFTADRVTDGAPVDLADGFIHFSTGKQVAETAARYFTGERRLVLAGVESDDLGEALAWEPSRGGELFPHLYREIHIDEVMFHRPLPLGPEGHEFPDGVL